MKLSISLLELDSFDLTGYITLTHNTLLPVSCCKVIEYRSLIFDLTPVIMYLSAVQIKLLVGLNNIIIFWINLMF